MFDFTRKLINYPEKIDKCIAPNVQNSLSTIFLDMVSGICNHDCIFCDGKYNYLPQKMFKEERLFSMLGEMKDLGTDSVIIVGEGGESTLHPCFARFAQALIEEEFHVGLYTNGSINLQNVLDVLVDFDFVRISLDSGETATHLKIHQGGEKDFEKAISLARELKERGIKNVGFSFIVLKDNCADIRKAINVAEEIGVDYIEFKPFYEQKYMVGLQNAEMIMHALADAQMYINEKNLHCQVIFNNQFQNLLQNVVNIGEITRTTPRRCLTSKLRMVVSPTGCYLCTCFRNDEKYCMGDPNTQSLTDIWYGAKHIELLTKLCCYRCTYDAQNERLLQIQKNGYEKEYVNANLKQTYFL